MEDEDERDKEKRRVRKKRRMSPDDQDEPVKERRRSRPSLPVSFDQSYCNSSHKSHCCSVMMYLALFLSLGKRCGSHSLLAV